MTGPVNNNNHTYNALNAYAKGADNKKGGKLLLGLNKAGQLVAEKVSTLDFVKAFFGFGKATKYGGDKNKIALATSLLGKVNEQIGLFKKSNSEDKITVKQKLTTMKTALTALQTHLSHNSQHTTVTNSIQAVIKKLGKGISQLKEQIDKTTARYEGSNPSGSSSSSRSNSPVTEKSSATNSRASSRSGSPTSRGSKTPSPTPYSGKSKKSSSKDHTLAKVKKQAGDVQNRMAALMAFKTKGTKGSASYDLKNIPLPTKKWLLETFAKEFNHTNKQLKDYIIELKILSKGKSMNVTFRKPDSMEPEKTHLFSKNALKELLSRLDKSASGTEGTTDEFSELKSKIKHRRNKTDT